MANYSDSSGSSDDLGNAFNEVLAADDPLGSSWHAESELDEGTPGEAKDPAIIAARAYQVEMLEASLKENIIVVMGTGIGKTQVAVLRIRTELERMRSDKVIWFLAPTVSLCAQQFAVIKTQIPSILPKLVTGSDKVDSWSKTTWEAVLFNAKLVVTTHQVLLDALMHGFVQISSLALIIFDEAHNCTKRHPGSRIMKEFYREAKDKGNPIPHILGLTASPVVRSDIASLEELEDTLDSLCRSPTRHREELLAHTKRPLMFNIQYNPKLKTPRHEYTQSMVKLHRAFADLDLKDDPYVQWLCAQNTDRSRRKLNDAVMKRETYIQRTMKTFCRRSVEICRDSGSWAADWYISETIRRFLAGIERQRAISQSFKDAEVVYLARIFSNAEIGAPLDFCDDSIISDKVRQLIDVLIKYKGEARGIVFAKERATTVVLARMLSSHPEIKKRYRIGTMVGTSFVPGIKQDFLDLAEKNYSISLEAFRAGHLNLLVATSVLEEGIDVPACNLVMCMDRPANLKSFIQRRGRARMGESHLYLFEETADVDSKREWGLLEAEMKLCYEDDQRELQILRELEESEAPEYPELRVESTGARLTINDAKSHLDHFCATLSSRKFVDFTPDYLIEKVVDEHARPGTPCLLKATVLLPMSLPPEVRQATSRKAWISERNACKDAAFQAYEALYKAGLIDDNLLPLKKEALGIEIEGRPGMTEAAAQFVPWVNVAHAWNGENVQLHRYPLIVLDQSDSVKCEVEVVLPVLIPQISPVTIYLDHRTHFNLHIGRKVAAENVDDSVDITYALLSAAYAHRRLDIRQEDFVVRLAFRNKAFPLECSTKPFDLEAVADGKPRGLVRDIYRNPYQFESILWSKPPVESVQKAYKGFDEDPENMVYLAVSKFHRGPGLFHRPLPPQQPPSTKPYNRLLPLENSTIDDVSLEYAEVGLLTPSLIHYLELYLIASELSSTLLAPLRLSNISMVVDAICASSARTPMNYERIEFLGDSILKLCVTVNVAATNLRLPEGLLSRLKDRMVCNARLCRAACESGLDQFIVSTQLALKGSGGRWRPPYISDMLEAPNPAAQKRIMSSKTLADVVESIIGVSYMDGRLPKALQCMSLFLGEGQFRDFQSTRDVLFGAAEPKNMTLPAWYEPLEGSIGYVFHEKALLVEAITHPSYNVSGVYTYERLEFMGDAILDHIIVEEPRILENWQMHLLRTALVNGDILGFLIMEWGPKLSSNEVVVDDGSGSEDDSRCGRRSPDLKPVETISPLWSFMRYQSTDLTIEREATCKRHAELREAILEAIYSGTHYPWALLARLHAPKFFSDLYEALVGAIWVDSGSFDACRAFVERSGLLPYLNRLRQDPSVHVLHPKEELGRLADSEKVSYMVREHEGADAANGRFGCQVFVGNSEIVDVGGALFKEEAKVRAATEAVAMLSAGLLQR
ncbi:Dicer-like protein 2 [Diaporthe australafricana]|uniref:Dicer-like protein 2 n=1 Tax=Diaporthe australafricana TaxID=127596 RepID=A0ABR3W890_9PEZI